MGRLEDAVRNDLLLLDGVCAAHGLRTVVLDGWWRTDGPPPPFSPIAQTLRPGVDPAPLVDAARSFPGAAVKDAFADLDLVPDGFAPLFDATWLEYRPGDRVADPGWVRAATEEERAGWLRAAEVPLPPALLRSPGIDAVAVRDGSGVPTAGALLVDSGPVLGIWDFFGEERPGALWGSLVRFAAGAGKPLVGYERLGPAGVHVALGAVQLGPLRVWVTAPAG